MAAIVNGWTMSEPENTSYKESSNDVRKWLSEQGFPLEMKVAEAFRSHFSVRQAQYYTDPESGKLREVDVVASQGRKSGAAYFEFYAVMNVTRLSPFIALLRPMLPGPPGFLWRWARGADLLDIRQR
jgi:hypothetical protein